MDQERTLICDDCFNQLPLIETGSVDLVILDPPYDQWDNLLKAGLWEQILRVCNRQANILCFTKVPFKYKLLAHTGTKNLRWEFQWVFANGGAWMSNRLPLIAHNTIYWYVMDKKQHFFSPQTGIAHSPVTRKTIRNMKVFKGYMEPGKEYIPNKQGVWLRDIIFSNKPEGGSIYVQRKPLDLIDILIRCFSPEGGLILDPFMGLGSTIQASVNLGRRVIGIENNEEIFKAIKIMDGIAPENIVTQSNKEVRMTREELITWGESRGWRLDKYGNLRMEKDGKTFRLKFGKKKVRGELLVIHDDKHREWVRLGSNFYKNLSISDEGGKLLGMKRTI